MISTHAFTEGDSENIRCSAYAPISTHAFTEGDCCQDHRRKQIAHFNSRLHGRRRPSCIASARIAVISTHAFTEGDGAWLIRGWNLVHFNSRLHGRRRPFRYFLSVRTVHFNSRLHGRRLQIQIIFAAKHFLFLLILSKFLILAFLFHLASLRFSLHPVIFPVRISLYFSVYLPFALETCTLCHNI